MTHRISTRTAVAALLLCLAGAAAVAEPAAVVIYAEGGSLTVIGAGGTSTELDALGAVGRELEVGDTLATEHGTFVELQLLPSDNLVKVAENTNFTIERREGARGGLFNLVYGRVRAKVRLLTNQDDFIIRSDSASAGVRGTDFGVSVVLPGRAETDVPGQAELEAQPAVTQVFCFEGEVQVTPEPVVVTVTQVRLEPVTVRANEIVSVSRVTAQELKTEVLPPEVRAYWEQNDFKAEPAAATAAGGEPGAQPAAEGEGKTIQREPAPELVTPVEELVRRTSVNQTRFRAVSVLLFAVGAAFEVAGLTDLLIPEVNIFGDNGWGMVGVGAVFITGGIFSTVQSARLGQELKRLQGDGP
jgi:hypothetical protein